jgi:hypothetical protein
MTQLPIAGGSGELEPVEVLNPPQKVGNHLLRYWIAQQPLEPAQCDIAKNGRVARFIAENYTVEQIYYALQGIEHIFPYSEQGWNLLILRRHFDRAMQIGFTNGDRRKQRETEALIAKLQGDL